MDPDEKECQENTSDDRVYVQPIELEAAGYMRYLEGLVALSKNSMRPQKPLQKAPVPITRKLSAFVGSFRERLRPPKPVETGIGAAIIAAIVAVLWKRSGKSKRL